MFRNTTSQRRPKPHFPSGCRVRIVNTGNRPYLARTVGKEGRMELDRENIHIVYIDGGGQHTYPLSALELIPHPVRKHETAPLR